MTKKLAALFEHRHLSEASAVINFVAGLLLGQQGVRGQSPFEEIDVEKVMTAIDLLAGRHDLEIEPFVFAWHPRVAALETPGRLPMGITDDIKRGLVASGPWELERPLRLFVESVAGVGEIGQVYRSALEDITAALVEMLAAHGDTSYLRPLIDLGGGSGCAVIATLNYDRTIEDEAHAAGVVCSTGIESWAEQGEWSWPSTGVRLLKLHGSIDWEASEYPRTDALTQYRIRPVGAVARLRRPAVIFGGRNKLRAEGPFLELLAELESMLREASTLLVIGYSFRDDHVNEILRRWINRSPLTRIVIVDPSFPDHRQLEGFRRQLWRALMGRPEGSPAPGTSQPPRPGVPARLRVVKSPAKIGLPMALRLAQSTEPWQFMEL